MLLPKAELGVLVRRLTGCRLFKGLLDFNSSQRALAAPVPGFLQQHGSIMTCWWMCDHRDSLKSFAILSPAQFAGRFGQGGSCYVGMCQDWCSPGSELS